MRLIGNCLGLETTGSSKCQLTYAIGGGDREGQFRTSRMLLDF